MKNIKLFILIFIILAVIIWLFGNKKANIPLKQANIEQLIENQPTNKAVNSENDSTDYIQPLDRFEERVNKKSFGDYITPNDSPVQPEKFIGYHTGIDLEIFLDEEEKNISIKSICAGPIEQKRFASGYGGLVVQKCLLNDSTIFVIYGHLNLSSIDHQLNDYLSPGDVLGSLGKGYSAETDYERKHLHLGIYQSEHPNIKGYVQNKEELKNWINPLIFLK